MTSCYCTCTFFNEGVFPKVGRLCWSIVQEFRQTPCKYALHSGSRIGAFWGETWSFCEGCEPHIFAPGQHFNYCSRLSFADMPRIVHKLERRKSCTAGRFRQRGQPAGCKNGGGSFGSDHFRVPPGHWKCRFFSPEPQSAG